MTTTTTLPAIRHTDEDARVVVFCQPLCRSAYDGPTCTLEEISVDLVHPDARCWCCGGLLRPNALPRTWRLDIDYFDHDDTGGRISKVCSDCGRPSFYDYADQHYHHATDAATGCFLIPAEDRADDPHHPLVAPTMDSLRRVLAAAAQAMGVGPLAGS